MIYFSAQMNVIDLKQPSKANYHSRYLMYNGFSQGADFTKVQIFPNFADRLTTQENLFWTTV